MDNDKKKISLELAMKLHELGVRVESEWWWNKYNMGFAGIKDYGWSLQSFNGYKTGVKTKAVKTYPAYDTAELGEMLPIKIMFRDRTASLVFEHCTEGVWHFYYSHRDGNLPFCKRMEERTEAEARGKMLVWLIENGHVKAEEL